MLKPKWKRTEVTDFNNAIRLRGRQRVFNGFGSKIVPMGKQTQGKEHPLDLACVAKSSDYSHLKILTSISRCFKDFQ